MSLAVDSSGTDHNDIIRLWVPATEKPRCKPSTPSPLVTSPRPVSQALKTTNSKCELGIRIFALVSQKTW